MPAEEEDRWEPVAVEGMLAAGNHNLKDFYKQFPAETLASSSSSKSEEGKARIWQEE